MLKRGAFILIFLLVALGLRAQTGEIRIKPRRGARSARLAEPASGKLKISVNFDKLNWKQGKESNGEEYTLLWFDGSKPSGEVGEPQLPTYRKLILLPLGATANARMASSSVAEFSLKEHGVTKPIAPVQPSVRKDKDPRQVPFVQKKETYAKRGYTHHPTVSVEVLGNMRSYTVARLVVSPVDYNPVEEKVKVHGDIEVEVEVVGGTQANSKALGLQSPHFDVLGKSGLSMVSDIFDSNPDKTKYPVKMLIISHRMFESSLAPFIQWKTQKGFRVTTAYTDEIGSTSAQIKSYIQQQYSAATEIDPAPTFLVFVGDVEQVAAWGRGPQSEKQTDLYYASVDGDMFPEMYYGRLSATTPQQLDNIVDKILYYEKYQFQNPEYLNRATLIAGADGQWNPRIGQPTIKYGTANYFNPGKGFSLVNEYGVESDPSNPSAQAGYTGCYDAQRIAVGFINYTAHCEETSWQGPKLYASDVRAFTNVNAYPFTVANCCLSADFGTAECIGETWLRGESKGAVTYIGSSPSSYWKEDMYWAVGAFPMVGNNNGYVPTFAETTTGGYDAPFVSNYQTAGAMVFAGNLAVTEADLKDYPQQINPQYYWEAYNILGDPSLVPFFTEAAQNEVLHAPAITVGSEFFSVSALKGTYVAITNGSEILGTQYFDKTEQKSIPLAGPDAAATLTVTATRAQTVPHIATVNAVLASGAYVTLNSFTVSDDAPGNGNGKIDFGETVKVNLVAKNFGMAKATNTRVLIENRTGYATLTSPDSVFIGDVDFEAGSNAVTVGQAFTFGIAANTPDRTTERFTLTFRSDQGEWTANLNLRINTPSIVFGNLTIDDSSEGNNNSTANFGETFYGVVEIKNAGSSSVNDISLTFSIPDSIADLLVLSTEPQGGISVDPGQTVSRRVKVSVKPGENICATYPIGVGISSVSYPPLNQQKDFFVDASTGNIILMGNQSVSACSSLFYDSGGESGHHGNRENHVTTISAATEYSKLKVSFSKFSLEEGWDFLRVYDGTSTSAPQVAGSPFTGNTLPTDIVSSGNALTFGFSSDDNTTSPGWEAVVTCVAPTTVPPCVSTPYPADGSTTLFPNKLSWNAVENAHFYDIYLGNSAENLALLGRTYEPSLDVILERNKDYYWRVLPGNYLGICSESCNVWHFKTPTTMGEMPMGDGEVAVDSVWFYDSGGSGGNYKNRENHTLTFKPIGRGAKLKVDFHTFDVETNASCDWDYLSIFNGPTTQSELVGTYCGASPPPSYTSTGANGELTFKFYSDNRITNQGWKARVSSVNTQPHHTLTVNVRHNNQPVGNASVRVDGLIGTTAADGSAIFSVPQGTFTYTVNANGFSPCSGTAVNNDSDQTVNVDLERIYRTTVTVLDHSTNQPIHGAKVTANNGAYYTAPSGLANILAKQGSNPVAIDKAGFGSQSGSVNVTADGQNVEFRLTPITYTLTVQIMDIYGVAVPSAQVGVDGSSATANAGGVATIGVPHGASRLTISSPGFLTSTQWVNAKGDSSLNVCLDYLQSEQRDVTFEIYGEDPLGVTPLGAAKLTLLRNQKQVLSAPTSSLGRVQTRLAEGNYEYSVQKEGYLAKSNIPLSVGSSPVLVRDTLMSTAFEVTFVVTAGGNALPGASVSVEGYGTQLTGASGTATFDAVGYSTGVQYSVSKEGYYAHRSRASITAKTTISVNLVSTGIGNLGQEKLVIYPNPANLVAFLNTDSSVELIQIMSVTGVPIRQLKPENETIPELPLHGLASGTYIVKVKLGNGKTGYSKLIKM